MQISQNELKKLNVNLDLNTLENDMFQLGHEVEVVTPLDLKNVVIGKIVEITKHPNADRLNICTVDIGDETLQIICGAPNVELNKNVIVAKVGAKLGEIEIKKAKIKGVESNGMLCSLEEIGFNKAILTKEDIAGIHIFEGTYVLGENAFEQLNIKDNILDLFITANRGDCQSYRGIYNDLSALINYNEKNHNLASYNIPNSIDFEESIANEVNVSIKEGTSYFSHRILKDINVKDSSWERKLFLLKHDLKSQNEITDISNEILFKYGIPSHIYDKDKIVGNVVVEFLKEEEKFIGLDEKEIALPVGSLVIKDEEKIICLAGVMGSYETRVTNETKNILVEVAAFEPSAIFKNTKAYGKKTEAAFRYEKGIDLTITSQIMDVITNEIVKVNENVQISAIRSVGSNEMDQEEVTLKYENVKKILGIEVPKEDVQVILSNLQFEVTLLGDDFVVKVPSFRKDIEGENDLIEEVIRVYNIDNIQVDDQIISFSNIDKIIKNQDYKLTRNIEEKLQKLKLNQVITYSLISLGKANKFLVNPHEYVKLMHPLSNEHSTYRQSIIPSLIQVAKENYAYQESSTSIFEVANTYYLNGSEIVEEQKLAILQSGDFEKYHLGAQRTYDFYDVKEKVEQLLVYLNLDYTIEKSDDIKELNPYAQAKILISKEVVGYIGEVVFDYDKKIKNKLYVAEINISLLKKFLPEVAHKKFEDISFMPKITRDLTVEVPEQTKYSEIVEHINSAVHLIDVILINVYAGEQIKERHKSVTLRLVYQHPNKTLTNEEIDEQMNKIFETLEQQDYAISGK